MKTFLIISFSLLSLLSVSAFAETKNTESNSNNMGIDLTLPPIIFVEITNLMQMALNTNDNAEKIEIIKQMEYGLNSLPPCKIHTANAMYTIALDGNEDVKKQALESINKSLKTVSTNFPAPSFLLAKVILQGYARELSK